MVVTGCLAERYQQEIRKEMPEVDAVVGIGSNAAIASILERLERGETGIEATAPRLRCRFPASA